jgi:hypothetical protein
VERESRIFLFRHQQKKNVDQFSTCSLHNANEVNLLSSEDGTSCKTTVASCNIVLNVVAFFSCADILHTYLKC